MTEMSEKLLRVGRGEALWSAQARCLRIGRGEAL